MNTNKVQKGLLLLLVLALCMPFALGNDKKEDKAKKQEEKRQKIDRVAKETLAELFESSEGAKKLYNKAYGHAVFSTTSSSSSSAAAAVRVSRSAAARRPT